MVPMLYRLSGALLIAGALLGFLGQAVALGRWSGYYHFSSYLSSDLGITTCDAIRDDFGPRYVCSPGHAWFNLATLGSGVLLVLAGVALILAGQRATRRETVAGYLGVGVAVVLAGIALGVLGLVPADRSAAVHAIAGVLRSMAVWVAMILAIRTTTAAASHSLLPMLTPPVRRMSILLLIVSLLGFTGFILLGTMEIRPGLFERLNSDILSVWVILLGIALWTAPGRRSTEETRRRRREERQAAARERETATRKAAQDLDGQH